MQSRIGMWGGSCAIRLPKMAVETLGLHDGENVILSIENGRLVIIPAAPVYQLDDLVKQARRLTPPASLDDGAIGEEQL